MRLTSVQISHYKSLSEVHLDNLQPLTLLVGANGTGKSNLVDVLRFLRDMAKEGLEHAMNKRGGILMVRQYSPKKPYDVTIRVEFDGEIFEEWRGFYEITIASLKGGNYQVKQEIAEWCEDDFEFDENDEVSRARLIKRKLYRTADGIAILDTGSDDPEEETLTAKLAKDQSAFFDSFFQGYAENPIDFLLYQLRFSSIFPNTLRAPSRPDTDNILKESGANWASVIKALKKDEYSKRAMARILEMMQVVMPNLQDITVRTVGAYLVPEFRVKDSDKAAVHAFDPVQLSDGTLRIFGILLALYQTPPPPFIALEEPEQTIHPAVLAMLAEAFREVSERTQLLITSHSPYLVDQFQPEEIRIVTMQDGKTRVSPIKTSQMESVKENLITLQELMVAEGLLAEGQ